MPFPYTIEDFKDAYARIGYSPCQKEFIGTKEIKTCCPLSAIALSSGKATVSEIDSDSTDENSISRLVNISPMMVIGFIHRFDGNLQTNNDDDYKVGHEAGIAARLSLLGV